MIKEVKCYPNTELPIGSLVLTQEQADTIKGMLTSRDTENIIMGQNLILNVNLTIPSNWHYLYQIIHYNYTAVTNFANLRTKKGRDLNKIFSYREIYSWSELQFVRKLLEKDINFVDDFIQKNYKKTLHNHIESRMKDLIITKLFNITYDAKDEYPHLKKDI